MKYGEPTPENIITSIDNILKKEYDLKVRIRFFLGIIKILEEDHKKFVDIVLNYIDKLLLEN